MAAKAWVPLCLLLLAGCSLEPPYARPAAPVPAAFPQASAAAEAAADLAWTDYFGDPNLQAIIRLALASNRDLRVSGLNVRRAQALYRIQRSQLWPSLGVEGVVDRYRVPAKVSPGGQAYVYSEDLLQVGTLSWELDFFGRIASLKDQALNQYLATEQAQAASRIALVASVAQGYQAYAADQESLRLAQDTLEAQQATRAMIQGSFEAGVASQLDLSEATSQVEAARADQARARGQVAADRNALDLLAGGPVPEQLLPADQAAAGEPRDVPAGLPSQVLLRRPDILAAEFQLKAANANIGAARAAFFPSVSLTAGVGTMSPNLSGLFGAGSKTWLFNPQLLAPIWAGGALKAGLEGAKVDRDIAVAQYEGAIQTAFREVADGLARRSSLADQVEAETALAASLEDAQRLARLRYQAGLDSYLAVLVAQRSLYAAQQGLVATRLAFRNNQITLYKALAGEGFSAGTL